MVTTSFGNYSANGMLSMHSWLALFFLFWGWGEGELFVCLSSLFPMRSHHVHSMCTACSFEIPQVPKLFLNGIPNGTSILSHMICPKFNTLVHKLKRLPFGGILLLTEGSKRCFHWGECPIFQKLCWWSNEYDSFKSKTKQSKESYEHTVN